MSYISLRACKTTKAIGASVALTDEYCIPSYPVKKFPIHLRTGATKSWLTDRTVGDWSDNHWDLYCQWWRDWEGNTLWYVDGTDNEYQWNPKLSGGKWDGSWERGVLLCGKGLKQGLIDAALWLSGNKTAGRAECTTDSWKWWVKKKKT